MKTTLSTFAMVFAFVLSAIANEKTSSNTASVERAVSHYMEAVLHGQTAVDEQFFAEDFEMRVYSSSKEQKINKKQLTKFLKTTAGLSYDCKTSYQVLDSTPRCTIAKVEMAFEHFTRIDYVTLCLADQDWKIRQVVSTYP